MDVLITTSRKPSVLTRRLGRALARYFGYKYYNRGKMSFNGLFKYGKEHSFSYVYVLQEFHGNPHRLVKYDISGNIIASLKFTLLKLIKSDEWQDQIDFEKPFTTIKNLPIIFMGDIGFSSTKKILRKNRIISLNVNDLEVIVLKIK